MEQIKKTLTLIGEIEKLLTQLGARDTSPSGQRIFGQRKLSEVKHKLPPELTKKLRWIYTIRNKAVHDVDYKIKNFNHYVSECEKSISELRKIIRKEQGNSGLKLSPLFFITLFLTLTWYFFSDDNSGVDKEIEITKNIKTINSLKKTAEEKTTHLESLKSEQGLLRSIFNDTEEIDFLEHEIEEMLTQINKIKEINSDLE